MTPDTTPTPSEAVAGLTDAPEPSGGSLSERINARLCHEPGCRREPRYPDMAFCDEHRVRWLPKRPAKDLTGHLRDAA